MQAKPKQTNSHDTRATQRKPKIPVRSGIRAGAMDDWESPLS